MKDNELKEKFGEYFKGVDIPENITADAKKSVKPPKPLFPRLLRWAAAAASILIICVVSVLALYNNLPSFEGDAANAPSSWGGSHGSQDSNSGEVSGGTSVGVPNDVPDEPASPDNPSDNSQDSVNSTTGNYYDKNVLAGRYCDPYTAGRLHSALSFIPAVNDSRNASVTECTAYYRSGELTLVESDISILDNLNRYDAHIFVELTEKTYLPLANYSYGEKKSYNGYTYYLTQTVAENGEPEFKVLIESRGVKYYFDVVSSDENSYLKLLKLFFG